MIIKAIPLLDQNQRQKYIVLFHAAALQRKRLQDIKSCKFEFQAAETILKLKSSKR